MPTDRSPLLVKTRAPRQTPYVPGLHKSPEGRCPASNMALLCFVRFAEPLSFSILLPFVNHMVQSTGTKEELVGYRAGYVEGVFSLVSALVMVPWALASDKLGRKPCLIVSLCGTAVATAMFGFSQTLCDMLMWRAAAGAFSGSSVVLRTLFSEVTVEADQARAFSYYAFAGNIALLIGPILGGSFSEPAQQFPSLFKGVRPLVEYPYALPGLIVCGLLIIVSAGCWALLEEPQRAVAPQKAHAWSHYLTTEVTVVLSVFSIAMLLGNCYTALVPLWAYTAVELGGLGWAPLDIAAGLACTGLLQALWLLLALPHLDKKLGSRRLTQLCFLAWPVCLLSPVLINQLMRQHWQVWAYFAMAVSQTYGTGVAMAFTTSQLLLNRAAPPEALGTLNGVALALNAIFRSAGPVAISSTFAAGLEHHILLDHLAWFVLAGVAMAGFLVSQKLSGTPRPDSNYRSGEVAEV